jgi:hypothetical protein
MPNSNRQRGAKSGWARRRALLSEQASDLPPPKPETAEAPEIIKIIVSKVSIWLAILLGSLAELRIETCLI